MGFGFCLRLAFFLSVWSSAQCEGIPNGVLHMECHDRYFMIAVDLSFTGEEPHFEAVDESGVYSLNETYSAECGYTVLSVGDRVELRASYFSCHTDNTDDEVFTFNLNLITTQEGQAVTYALTKTCSPSLPWSPREVTCELNYMEVSVRSEVSCPSGTIKDNWDALKHAHGSTTSDWQVTFHRENEQSPPMNLSDARTHGYVFDMTSGRLVFRTPYGQPDAFSTEVNGVPVEVVHATIFSRQSWVVLMVDLVAACSMNDGSYADSGYIIWKSSEVLYPSTESTQLNIGLNGDLVESSVSEERGYVVETHNNTLQIRIPHDAEGVHRKSFVSEALYEFYILHLYLEQILVDEDLVETRLRFFRTLSTTLLPRPVVTENQTLLEELTFTVYLGGLPEDVALVAVRLNGEEFTVPFSNRSGRTITNVFQPNNAHGYTLKVPFDDPVVTRQLSREDAVLQYRLNINYMLSVLPENDTFYRFASVEATFTDVSPPVFDAVCSESGISFRLDNRPYDYLWEITIGLDPLTSELATQHGYIMRNNSQSVLLEVPLYAHGYEYKDLTLIGFFGTFEILVRDPETSEVQSSTAKTCLFTTTEFILCSTDGRMTVVADLSLAIPSGGVTARTSAIDKHCGPKETDDTRALFSIPLSGCGTRVKLGRDNVTYQNEIVYSPKNLNMNNAASAKVTERVVIQCTYPLAGLHRLFAVQRFESDSEGVGSIIHTTQVAAVLLSPTKQPTTALVTVPPRSRVTAVRPRSRYVMGSMFHNLENILRKAHPIIIPADFFYTDPTMTCGRRIPNSVSELRVFDCFQLNTPPPVMSACPTPPACPDPFRARPHPTMELGSLTLKINVLRPAVQPNRLVLQLTQEEDQAVTNLLKLHHQEEPAHSEETTLFRAGPLESTSAEEASQRLHPSKASLLGHEGRRWSDTEIEAANTLLSGFSLMDKMWNRTSPDPVPDLLQGSGTLHALITPYSTSHNVRFCDGGDGEPSYGDYLSESKSSISGDFSEVKKRKLSESEGDAVHVLLSLADMAVLMQ
ncbi:uncharacterized protein LOC132958917 [Labrus mixtus]|uniref:uncharacterized protein LOC132958917 n=1 Tax=Labrus mixtus TaxID=508554 RepID=UPI0029C020E4|nr:uncharacterized protein LOC132958917 [Labrus mixtus]